MPLYVKETHASLFLQLMVHVAPVGSGAYPAQPTIGMADQNTALSHAAIIISVYEYVVIFWPASTPAQFIQVSVKTGVSE